MSRKPGYIRDEILMLLGFVVGGFGALALASGRRSALAPALVFTSAGLVMFLIGLKFRRIENRLRRTLEVLRSVDRSTLLEVARNTGDSLDGTRRAVHYLIGHGFVAMRFDPKTDTLFSPRDRGGPAGGPGSWIELPGRCPTCFAPTPTMIPSGLPYACEYCRAPVPGKPVAVGASGFDPNQAARPQAQLHGDVFSGNWGVLILLFLVCWPVAIFYLQKGLKRQGGSGVFSGS